MIGEYDLGINGNKNLLWLNGSRTSFYFRFGDLSLRRLVNTVAFSDDKFHIPKEFFR